MDTRRALLTQFLFVRDLAPFRRLLARAVAAGSVAVLAGCGSGGEPQTPSTVTVTASSPTPSDTAEPEPEEGDVLGRDHDAGAIVDVKEVAGQPVLVLDRWTVLGVEDSVLASDGVPVVAHTDERFTNQNTRSTYDVPVAPDVMVVINECQPSADPATPPGLVSRPSSLEEFLELPDVEEIPVLLTYSDGQLAQLDTDARC